jgi:hypothetical protein
MKAVSVGLVSTFEETLLKLSNPSNLVVRDFKNLSRPKGSWYRVQD